MTLRFGAWASGRTELTERHGLGELPVCGGRGDRSGKAGKVPGG